MSDNLVKRLRSLGSAGPGRISFLASEDAMKAADRIEKLEDELHHCFHRINELQAALRSIAANACCDSCREAALVARKALGGKDD